MKRFWVFFGVFVFAGPVRAGFDIPLLNCERILEVVRERTQGKYISSRTFRLYSLRGDRIEFRDGKAIRSGRRVTQWGLDSDRPQNTESVVVSRWNEENAFANPQTGLTELQQPDSLVQIRLQEVDGRTELVYLERYLHRHQIEVDGKSQLKTPVEDAFFFGVGPFEIRFRGEVRFLEGTLKDYRAGKPVHFELTPEAEQDFALAHKVALSSENAETYLSNGVKLDPPEFSMDLAIEHLCHEQDECDSMNETNDAMVSRLMKEWGILDEDEVDSSSGIKMVPVSSSLKRTLARFRMVWYAAGPERIPVNFAGTSDNLVAFFPDRMVFVTDEVFWTSGPPIRVFPKSEQK